MSFVYKIALFILMLIVQAFCPVRLNAQVEVDQNYGDSLQLALDETEIPADRIVFLKKLAAVYWQQPEEATCLKQLVDLSMEMDSFDLVYAGMTSLCRYYYNESREDSLLYWKNQIDSLARVRSESPTAFYSAGNLLCRYYLGAQNYELAINEAINLINEAHAWKQNDGMIRANQSLGYVYHIIGRYEDAARAYGEGYSFLKKFKASTDSELQYLSEMILPYLHHGLLNDADTLLARYHELVHEKEKEYKVQGLQYPVVWHHWLVYSYYTELALKRGEMSKAGHYLSKARRYADESTDEVMKYEYYRVSALYYYKSKKYEQALLAIDNALAVEVQSEILKIKIDILRAAGRINEAMVLYEDLFALNAKINDDAFERQIRQLRSLNDLSDREKQMYELKHQSEQLAMRQQLLIVAMLVSLVLIVLLSIVVRYYIRARKLKNALLKEKDSLVESEQLLRIAKDKAEEANLLKTAFISNISHEVRTPLNAIVGFSQLLADNSYQEDEKRAFTETIQMNSELLMNLVNDVLDLSRLESGKIQLNVKPYDLVKCCREVLSSIDHYVVPGVKVTLTASPVEGYHLNTDDYRIKQLLGGLLRNAAKFTKQGEINLAFRVEEEMHQVRFMVTDTGCGIPIEMQYKIFDSFEKLDEFVQGTGLGLPICQKVAELLEGNLYLDSDYTGGARFVFIHPTNLSGE